MQRLCWRLPLVWGVLCRRATPATTAIKDIKAPTNVTLSAGSEKALFTNSEDIQQYLLNRGVLSADVYQLRYKKDNVFSYGIVADIRLGEQGLRTLGIESEMPVFLSVRKIRQTRRFRIAGIGRINQ
mgnify:CR=1 FL=1